MNPRSLLLRHALLAAIGLPLGGCGGSTTSSTGSTSTGGPGPGGGAGTDAAGGQGAGGASGQGGNAGSVSQGGSAGSVSQGGSAGSVSQGGSAGTAGSVTGHSYLPCADPMPLVVQGVDTGYVTCSQGNMHRAKIATCPSSLPRAAACSGGNGAASTCKTDAECTMHPNGRCDPPGFPSPTGCTCSYGCTTDADCAATEICRCGDPVGLCVPKQGCTSDADCGAGLCLQYNAGCLQSSNPTFACQSSADVCVGDADCAPGMGFGQICTITSAGGSRVCMSACVAGRPLVVNRESRLAPLLSGKRWG